MAKPYQMKRLGILNHVGGIWTAETFDTEADARAHMAKVAKQFPPSFDLSRHAIVPVRVTVSVIKPRAKP